MSGDARDAGLLLSLLSTFSPCSPIVFLGFPAASAQGSGFQLPCDFADGWSRMNLGPDPVGNAKALA